MPIKLPFIFFLSILFVAGPVHAATVVTATPPSPRPNQAVLVSGSGFGASEAVDLYLDTTDTKLVVSDASGAFGSKSLTIPLSTSPGAHTITGIGRRTGDAAQATVTVTTPWRQDGFGVAHYGVNPFENTLDTNTVKDLGLLWTTPSSLGSGAGTTPAVVLPNVYVTLFNGVAAINQTTGAVVWKVLTSETFLGAPAVVANVVYVASFSGTVYALNPTTGATLKFRALGGSIIGGPTVANGTLYVGNQNGLRVDALQTSSLASVYSFSTGCPVLGSPAVAAGVVYVGCNDSAGTVIAMDANSGTQLWLVTVGGSIAGRLAVRNGVVYGNTNTGNIIFAQRADNGSRVWASATGGANFGSPAVAKNTVYIGSNDGKLYAFNASDGSTRWQFATGGTVSSPAVANGVVYFTANGAVYALDAATGAPLITAAAGTSNPGSPAISDGVIYVDQVSAIPAVSAFASGAGGLARIRKPPPRPSDLHPDLSLVVSK